MLVAAACEQLDSHWESSTRGPVAEGLRWPTHLYQCGTGADQAGVVSGKEWKEMSQRRTRYFSTVKSHLFMSKMQC